MAIRTLGGPLAGKPLHFFWVLDVSGSMANDGKIQALNTAIHEVLPALRSAAHKHENVDVLVRVLVFSSTARWHVSEPTPLARFRWDDVEVEPQGFTELGAALAKLAKEMKVLAAVDRGITPAIVLVSDGQPTNLVEPSFRAGLERLMAEPWGNKAVRLAIGIGRDVDVDVLQRFIGGSEIRPVMASNPQQLVDLMRWATTYAVTAATVPTRASDLLAGEPGTRPVDAADWVQ